MYVVMPILWTWSFLKPQGAVITTASLLVREEDHSVSCGLKKSSWKITRCLKHTSNHKTLSMTLTQGDRQHNFFEMVNSKMWTKNRKSMPGHSAKEESTMTDSLISYRIIAHNIILDTSECMHRCFLQRGKLYADWALRELHHFPYINSNGLSHKTL